MDNNTLMPLPLYISTLVYSLTSTSATDGDGNTVIEGGAMMAVGNITLKSFVSVNMFLEDFNATRLSALPAVALVVVILQATDVRPLTEDTLTISAVVSGGNKCARESIISAQKFEDDGLVNPNIDKDNSTTCGYGGWGGRNRACLMAGARGWGSGLLGELTGTTLGVATAVPGKVFCNSSLMAAIPEESVCSIDWASLA